MNLRLTNPHAVVAALSTRPGDVLSLSVPSRGAGETWQRAAALASDAGIRVRQLAPIERERESADEGRRGGHAHGRSGGSRRRQAVGVHQLFEQGAERDAGRGLWLAIDQVQDPRNLGAIFRSASFFGVAGVLLTRDRAAPLSSVAYDTASGGLEYVPFAWASNLARDMAIARDAGLWILGAAGEADDDVSTVDRNRPWLLVLGNEEKGLRRLTREGCDQLCRLTPRGTIDSLNVSVAAAVLMAGLRRTD